MLAMGGPGEIIADLSPHLDIMFGIFGADELDLV
jgi:hypothetical protein